MTDIPGLSELGRMLEERFPHPLTRHFVSVLLILVVLALIVVCVAIICGGIQSAYRFFVRHQHPPLAHYTKTDTPPSVLHSPLPGTGAPPSAQSPLFHAQLRAAKTSSAVTANNPARIPAPASQPAATANPQAFGPCVGSVCGNNGGNPTVNNYGPPPPNLELISPMTLVGKQVDGNFQWALMFKIVASSPPNNVTCGATGKNVISSNISNLDSIESESNWKYGSTYMSKVDLPIGRYQIIVSSSSNTEVPEYKCALNFQ
jgi:hypothetical protein